MTPQVDHAELKRPLVPLEPLTPAETQVLDLLCEGNSPREIALARQASIETVRCQVGRMREKYGVPSTLKMVVIELKSRLAA